MPIAKKNLKLVKPYNPKIKRFAELPSSHRLAIAHYMVLDGESWDVLGVLNYRFDEGRPDDYSNDIKYQRWKETLVELLRRSMKHYISQYRDVKFGMASIPSQVLMNSILERKSSNEGSLYDEGITGEEEYMKMYRERCGIPNHSKTNRWPCILSGFEDEVLQDGFHRFASYVKNGHRTIPCIFYT